MSEILFKGKIVCSYCKRKHVHKNERGKIKYVCGFYNRKSSNCVRNLVRQEDINDLIFLRFRKELTTEEINSLVDYIEVSEEKIQINLYNDKEIILSNTYAQL